ncbi:hypothetical protein Ancab_031741, partial [Ancistrocladus abbreviatus]
ANPTPKGIGSWKFTMVDLVEMEEASLIRRLRCSTGGLAAGVTELSLALVASSTTLGVQSTSRIPTPLSMGLKDKSARTPYPMIEARGNSSQQGAWVFP